MPITNAREWSALCDKQAQLMDSLRCQFPERGEPLTKLSEQWREIKRQLDKGDIPHMLPPK